MWAMLAAEAAFVLRRHWGALHPESRRRLRELLVKSKGRPGMLTPAERREVIRHARQLDLRAIAAELGDVVSPVRLPGKGRRKRRAKARGA